MRKTGIILVIIILTGVFLMACENPYENYEELRQAGQSLMTEKKYYDAIALFEKYENCFPDKVYNITYNIGALNLQTGKPDDAVKAFERGVEKGAIFPLFKGFGIYEMIKDAEGAEELYTMNENARIKACEEARPIYELQHSIIEVMNPPLFIALHGGGENTGIFQQRWNSEKLKMNYNTIYIQSSQVFSTDRYWWEDVGKGSSDISAMLDSADILKTSAKDITIGGFSHGGRMALYYFLNSDLNIRKVIMLCPEIDLDEFYSQQMIDKIKNNGVEIILITGDQDQSIEQQRKFRDFLSENGIEMDYTELEGMGHMFSEDFYTVFDKKI